MLGERPRTKKELTMKKILLLNLTLIAAFFCQAQTHSVAREWNEVLLEAIRNDFARPTSHARNLFHISSAMYDAWAAYDDTAIPFLFNNYVRGYYQEMNLPIETSESIEEARNKAISYAAFNLIKHRFSFSPGVQETFNNATNLMNELGYDVSITSTDYESGDPAALGNFIAETYIQFGLSDGSNEQNDYISLFYKPINPPLVPTDPGNPLILDLNRWQPLFFDEFIDQSGNSIPSGVVNFLSPEWGQVTPFALKRIDANKYVRDGFEYLVFHDPGPPPYIGSEEELSDEYKWGFSMVSIWGAHLGSEELIDISPANFGNNSSYPTDVTEYEAFYNYLEGGDIGSGHDINPYTGEPYEPNMVSLGDYSRVLAEFWADGPDSETPPGHWFTILNYVLDHELFERKFEGQGDLVDVLEFDVKAYFILGGAMHDCAVSAWGIKGWYDYIRPISAIRAMSDNGQSSDPSLSNYNENGIPLVENYIELVEAGDPLAGNDNQHVGKIKLYTWRGHDYITDPETDVAGVGWILAENWWPYQRPTFVTPPFAGYVSGHSTFSRAAAEVLTLLTGDPYFPGGMGEFLAPQNDFLVFENGPSTDVTLQWATYRDASDQTSLSRIWGGIHPPADDIPGRLIGEQIGVDAFAYAKNYFEGIIPLATLKNNELFLVYPTKLHSGEPINIRSKKKNTIFHLISFDGKTIVKAPLDQGLHSVNLPNLEKGIYIYIIESDLKEPTSGKIIIE